MNDLTPDECKALIQFLDRISITGHGERQAMNIIVQKLALNAAPKAIKNQEDDPDA